MNTAFRRELISKGCWVVAALAVLPAVIVWYTGPHGGLDDLDGYRWFPLFGLIAFTLMWSHYVVGAARLLLGVEKQATKRFTSATGWIVLFAIVLHPGVLVFNLWRDGFGLPPASYLDHYVAPGLQWAAAIGLPAFLAFMAFELHRWFSRKNWWPYIEGLSDIAMILILIHAFALGGDLQSGWLRLVWLVYAEVFAAALVVIYFYKLKRKPNVVG